MCCVHTQFIVQYWSSLVVFTAAGSETECASWGWGGALEVRHHRPDVWWGRRSRWRGVWMDCETSVLSQPGAHQALCHAAVEIRGDSKVQGNAPQTSAKWTEFRQNATSYPRLRGGKQTRHGAVGFWASRELPICCVGRLCFENNCVFAFVLIKLLLWINSTFLSIFPLLNKFIHVLDGNNCLVHRITMTWIYNIIAYLYLYLLLEFTFIMTQGDQ